MSGKSRQPTLGGDDVSLFALPPVAAARALIGCLFEWDGCSGWIVEAEAYSEWNDEACHTHVRPSARRFVDEHPPGTAYVYLNYGVHWMTNVVVGDPVTGERGFVLLRALQPECGLAAMRERRGRQPATDLCSGPGSSARPWESMAESMARSSPERGAADFFRSGPAIRPWRGCWWQVPVSAFPRPWICRGVFF
ncbi:MAG: DNA-3-methyladenine glycosylase [Verrucomicrobiales bacterium]